MYKMLRFSSTKEILYARRSLVGSNLGRQIRLIHLSCKLNFPEIPPLVKYRKRCVSIATLYYDFLIFFFFEGT